MTRIMLAIMERDLRIASKGLGDTLAGCGFFAVIITLVPLAAGGVAEIGGAIIWIALLISAIPQMERFFGRDAHDGTLDDLILSPAPLYMVVLAKVVAGWIVIAAPLIIMAPILAVILGLGFNAIPVLTLSLIIGSFALMLLGALMGALIIGARRGVVLLAVLTLPLAMPVLIFGAAATGAAASQSSNPAPHLALLTATMLILLVITPFATAAALRAAAE